jgi:sensor histidine kinase YesM
MTNEQIIILTAVFSLAFTVYMFSRKKFTATSVWIKINLIFLTSGVIGAFAITPFLVPHDFLRNLVVLTVIPLSAFNVYDLFNKLAKYFRFGRIARELLGFFTLFAGILIGAEIINISGIGVFRAGDIKDTLLIAFVCNTARAVLSYASLLKAHLAQRKELQAAKLQEAQAASQLELLHDKINPHFLYNSLNSIAGLAIRDGKKTREMTVALSKLLRYSLNYNEDHLVPVELELEMVENYFNVERVRFGDRLSYEIHVGTNTANYLVPRFLLQPLVENSVKHAFDGTEGQNLIKITLSAGNNYLVILIQDNGKPFPDKIIPGHGLKNVSDKLSLLFPGKYELEMTNKPEKQTRIVIKELRT